MTEKDEERSFEDHFDELAGDAVPEAPLEMSIPDETDEGESHAAQEEEKEEEQTLRVLEPEGEEEPEPEAPETDTPSLEEQLTLTRAELQKERHRYNSDLGRQNAFKRQIKERDEQIAQLQRQIQNAAPQQKSALHEDYPDIAEGAQQLVGSALDPVNQRIAQMEQSIAQFQANEHNNFIQGQFAELEAEHPDWNDIAESPEFRHWITQQPEQVQAMYESDMATDAIYLIRSYKSEVMPAQQQDNSALKQRREKQLRQAQNVPSRGGRSQQIAPPDDDYEAAFDYFAELDERRN